MILLIIFMTWIFIEKVWISLMFLCKKWGGSKNILFCMEGRLFESNSLIKGVTVFNWKQETPEVN